MLHRRKLDKVDYGGNADKIHRLVLDDDVDRDTGDQGESELYAHIWAFNWIMKRLVAEQEKLIKKSPYIDKDDNELRSLLQGRQSPLMWDEPVRTSNTRPAMLKRLIDQHYDGLQKDLDDAEAERDTLMTDLEERIGHTVDVDEALAREEQQRKDQWKNLPIIDPQVPPMMFPNRMPDGQEVDYTKYKTAELVDMAKKEHIPYGGSRDDLIYRLSKSRKEALIAQAQSSASGSNIISPNPLYKDARTSLSEDGINYNTKDNSKLIRLVQDRGLELPKTRIEMIELLEKNPANYEAKTKKVLSQMLSNRLVRRVKGDKQYLVQLLERNDDVDRDTGNIEEGAKYGKLLAMRLAGSAILEKKEELEENNPFESCTDEELQKLMVNWKLESSDNSKVMIERLREHQEMAFQKEFERQEKNYDAVLDRFAIRMGRDVCPVKTYAIESQLGPIRWLEWEMWLI
ncbi:hypothetical protein M7I_5270 [Glarea lozoyensis 74030]|uniref:SAP domain-containing protein n=1 Tax=Glarea lozoyensis (strain ATCC 74030 / MF5533) TaxID=1104152 RepID=H0ERF1_GLAL7|nr:hypothetical protein M7I_5270 [Glarea lozoyensis 74030]